MSLRRIFRNWGNPAYLPLLVIMLVGFIAPMMLIVKMSLFDPDFTLENYIRFFSDKTYIQIFLRTFRTAFTVTLSCLILGYPLALFLTLVKEKTASILMIFIIIPFWVSILIRTFAWKVILANTGIINTLLLDNGIISKPLSLLYNSFAIHVSMIHILLPFMTLAIYGVMKGISPSYYNAALSMGASPSNAFLYVYVPMSLSGVLSGTMMVFIMALGFYITPSLLGGSNNTMLPVVIELQVNRALNWNFASAMAVILLTTTLIITSIYIKVIGVDKLGGTSS